MKIRKIRSIIGTILTVAVISTTVTGCGISFQPGIIKSESATVIGDLPADPGPAQNEAADEPEAYTDELSACTEEPEACTEEAEECETIFFTSSKKQNLSDGSYLDGLYDYNAPSEQYDTNDNTEEYSELKEMGYLSVKNHPLSTFAADVDTASYSNLRRLINEGYGLGDFPEGSVRIEEMLNYFDYDYTGPKKSEPFGVNTEIVRCPWNEDALLLGIGLKTEDIDFGSTPPSNLVFLIDVSGSMADYDKLPLLQDAFCMLADELSEKDRVSIVTYADGVDTVLKGATGDEKKKIKRAIRSLNPSGATNGGEGIQTAYRLAEKNFIKGGNNRIILATDGDLNLGITDVDDLHDLISDKKESGIYLSVLGFGTGNIKDNRMETLADNGNGNYSYIDSVREAKKVLVDELSSNMLTVCKDVKFQAEFNSDVVKGYRLLGYANRVMKDRDFDDDKKDGGEIGAGHELTVLYEIIPQKKYSADRINKKCADEELLTLAIRYKTPSGTKSDLLEYPITFENFTERPSEDIMFQSAVAEFGLLASDSLFSGEADIDNVIERLESLSFEDEYKEEFYKMVVSASQYNYGFYNEDIDYEDTICR
ncbi:MAG: VWA domain-containing protein [Lachnospiraceae bacterium]|nr:VWA domain-containing protein [Lachnospiraceae bacterium]